MGIRDVPGQQDGLAVVVLAGGTSRRMGRDKASLRIDGERLVDRLVRRLAGITDEIVVVSGPSRRLHPAGAVEITDAGRGPLDGVVAGLEAVGADAVGVLGVDMPDASPALLVELARMLDEHDAVVPVVDGHAQPLHAIWASRMRDELRRLLDAGVRSPTVALERLDVVWIESELWGQYDPSGRFAESWNRPGDVPPTVD